MAIPAGRVKRRAPAIAGPDRHYLGAAEKAIASGSR